MAKLTISIIEQRINSIYYSATIYKETVNSIRAKLDEEVSNELNTKYRNGRNKYTNWLRGFATGYSFSLDNRIMNEEVEFCYSHNDKLYSTKKDSIHPYWGIELSYEDVSKCQGNFYWKGTNKPYTTTGEVICELSLYKQLCLF